MICMNAKGVTVETLKLYDQSVSYLPVIYGWIPIDSDHTLGTIDGKYIYLEGSDTTRYGRTAAIRSPKINFGAAESYCLIFWYSMFGDHIGSLSVSIEFTLFNFELKLFTLTGEQMKNGAWKKEMIDIVKKVLITF